MKRTRIAMLIAVMTYAVALLLPVVDGGTTILSGGIPGWEALRVATPSSGLAESEGLSWKDRCSGS